MAGFPANGFNLGMNKFSLRVAALFFGAALFLSGCATAQTQLAFSGSADPRVVGKRIAENLLERNYRTNKPVGFIVYPEICASFGALRFAAATGDTNLERKLFARYAPVWLPENAKLIPPTGHVDNNVFGALPLEIFLLNGDKNFLALGLKLADRQWENPLTNGLTRETRWWVDDAWMIGSLQIQAFRATHDAKYADRVATQLAAYLDQLQEPNGLFHHGPEAPFFWARGNGWVAASLAEVLQSLPPTHPKYARLMAGYRKMMAGLKACQAKSGLWHQLLDDPASFEETSGTGMFTYAMITGVKRGWLGAEYADHARRGWLALCGKIDAKSNLREICVGTNQSKNKQFYLDRPRQSGDLHGQSPVLWCAWALVQP
jgi:unsaturated rhamnogalacturonyl hydrolase